MLRDRIREESDNRVGNINRIAELEDKYRNVVQMMQSERGEIDFVQRRHLKLLSTKILFESLESILYQNLQFTFSSIKSDATAHRNCVKGLI